MLASTSTTIFGPYRLDTDGVRRLHDGAPVPLQPRPLAVLRDLAAHPGEVIGRDELIARVWAGTHVTKAVLKVAVRAIREALDDDAEAPRYIETIGREGYRFIGSGAAAPRAPAQAVDAPMVGRADELGRLHASRAAAAAGARAVVFVTGEAGIGKSTLIDRFVADLRHGGDAWVARGQCLAHYGESEAYLPILEAIGRLVREDAGRALVEALRRHAPTWAAHLPALGAAPAPRARTGETTAPMPVRMLREMADALEVATRDRLLVLVLEDLQWSDRSTVDLLGGLARRREPARLLVVGSLRPAEVIVHDHPLRTVRHELLTAAQCHELALELLGPDDVWSYVAARFAGGSPGALRQLAACISTRTEGNALFMVNLVDDLVARGLVAQRDGRWHVDGAIEHATEHVPAGLHELIDRRLQGLGAAAHRVLESASVAGDEFTVAAVAAALGDAADAVEDVCEQLAAHGALVADAGVAEWPDGTITGRYRFEHALYRRVLYERMGEARRVRAHRAIGLRQEAAYGDHAVDHAAELAMHFGRGRHHAGALCYHEIAGRAALDRHAAHEAHAHFVAALAALSEAPDADDRREQELRLVVAIATLLMAIRGYAAPETERAFAHARALCATVPGATSHPVLRGLVSFHHVRAELADAREVGAVLLSHAAASDDPVLAVQAHYGQGATCFHLGELAVARAHLEAALATYAPHQHDDHVRTYGGYDPGVACSLWLAWTLALTGFIDEAVALDRDGLALAHRLADAFTLAWAHHAAGVSQQVFGDWAASEAASAAAERLAEEHAFPHVRAMASVNRGWALCMQGRPDAGIPLLRDGVAAADATGAGLVRPSYLGMLGAAEAIEGRREHGLARFDEGLAEAARTGERLHETGLLIGKSHLLAAGGARADAAAAEECLHRAARVARDQGARVLELRVAIALARHCRAQRRLAEARRVLTDAHAWFADRNGGAPEIGVARALLAKLGA